jgi:hypothetical protein
VYAHACEGLYIVVMCSFHTLSVYSQRETTLQHLVKTQVCCYNFSIYQASLRLLVMPRKNIPWTKTQVEALLNLVIGFIRRRLLSGNTYGTRLTKNFLICQSGRH